MVTIWVNYENFEQYRSNSDELSEGWNKKKGDCTIQLTVPLNEIIDWEDLGKEGVKFGFYLLED